MARGTGEAGVGRRGAKGAGAMGTFAIVSTIKIKKRNNIFKQILGKVPVP